MFKTIFARLIFSLFLLLLLGCSSEKKASPETQKENLLKWHNEIQPSINLGRAAANELISLMEKYDSNLISEDKLIKELNSIHDNSLIIKNKVSDIKIPDGFNRDQWNEFTEINNLVENNLEKITDTALNIQLHINDSNRNKINILSSGLHNRIKDLQKADKDLETIMEKYNAYSVPQKAAASDSDDTVILKLK